MAPAAQEVMMESVDNMVIEEYLAAEEASAEESLPVAEAPVAEEPAMEEVAPMEDSFAEEVESEAATGASATAESTPRVVTEAEKTAADQGADGIAAPNAFIEMTATAVADEALAPSYISVFSLWQKILIAAIIFLSLIGFIVRRVIILRWQKRK